MKRRVAFIDYFPTHYRRGLYEEIARRADADFYFYADSREHFWNRNIPLADEGDYHRVDLRRFRPLGTAVMPGIAPRLRPGRYDAVIKSLNGKLMLPLVYGTAKLTGLPFVLWTGMWHHPTTRVHRLSTAPTHAVYRGADAIVAYGDHVRRFLVEHPGVDAEKVFVAGQAVQASRFDGILPSRNGTATVLYVGQFEERKGLPDLIAAFRAIDDPAARLELVGNGSQEEQVRELAGQDERISVVGYVPQQELPERLARARCLVLPSVTTSQAKEPWGLVVNEAMHAGVPVVATEAVGAAAGGLVRDGLNGFVVPERDSGSLSTAIRHLVEQPDTAAEMGERARGDVARFDYDRMAGAFMAAVEHAIAAKAR
jgi:glycosyltransferase involved in cell wall biosynthesis